MHKKMESNMNLSHKMARKEFVADYSYHYAISFFKKQVLFHEQNRNIE